MEVEYSRWDTYLRKWLVDLVSEVGLPDKRLGDGKETELIDTGSGLRVRQQLPETSMDVFVTADDGPDLGTANLATMEYKGEVGEFALFNARSSESDVWIAQDTSSNLSISIVSYFDAGSSTGASDPSGWFERSTIYAKSTPPRRPDGQA